MMVFFFSENSFLYLKKKVKDAINLQLMTFGWLCFDFEELEIA